MLVFLWRVRFKLNWWVIIEYVDNKFGFFDYVFCIVLENNNSDSCVCYVGFKGDGYFCIGNKC